MPRCSLLQLASRSLHHLTRPLRILGIETSCDDTGAAVIEWSPHSNSAHVLSETLHSQVAVHVAHGGIVPPVAQTLHERHIEAVVQTCVDQADLDWTDLSAIAVTNRPGMPLSLKVGLVHAKTLVGRHHLPLIPIHHMHAHALTARLLSDDAESPSFPFLVLLLSGGHALLAVAHDVDEFVLLGGSLDISPGDCLDKFARRANLKALPGCAEVSGGEAVEMTARGGDPHSFEFRNVRMHHRDCNFSFSGLQSHGIRLVAECEAGGGFEGQRVRDLCASMQHAVATTICRRLQRAIVYSEMKELMPREMPEKTMVVSGGVAANAYIRRMVERVGEHYGYALICPPPRLCRDNGVMIAWNGVELARRGKGVETDIERLDFYSRCPMGEDLSGDVKNCNIRPVKIKFPPPPD